MVNCSSAELLNSETRSDVMVKVVQEIYERNSCAIT